MNPKFSLPSLWWRHSCLGKAALVAPLLAVALLMLFQNPAIAADGAATDASPCEVRVVANDVLVSASVWYEVAHHVQPAGVVENPDQWPYFAWSDTPLGVARSLSGDGYLFFGSDGGDHPFDGSLTQRAGSITVTTGTLDHPLGEPAGDPNPPPYEFLLPTSPNLPRTMDYVGGGPVYRVPAGEPGAGSLLLLYHTERNANPFWSWSGLAKSIDEGQSWQDLGLILSAPQAYDANGAFDIGDGTLVPYTDPATAQKYFYVYFPQHCWINSTDTCNDFTFLSAARASYDELLAAAASSATATGLFRKYYNGGWEQPGMGGQASELFPAVTGETDGDPQVAWSAYRNRFIAIMDNGSSIAYGESVDGITWPPMQVVLGKNPGTPGVGYANAIGLGADPGVLSETFYSFYTAWPKGVSWQPATINRLTITTAATTASLVPSSTLAGGAAFTLTVNGDHFVAASTVLWNGSPRATTYVSSTQVSAQITASDVATAGEAHVEVSNPGPCGGNSNSEPFLISPSSSAVSNHSRL